MLGETTEETDLLNRAECAVGLATELARDNGLITALVEGRARYIGDHTVAVFDAAMFAEVARMVQAETEANIALAATHEKERQAELVELARYDAEVY